jgi:hypothetical protein
MLHDDHRQLIWCSLLYASTGHQPWCMRTHGIRTRWVASTCCVSSEDRCSALASKGVFTPELKTQVPRGLDLFTPERSPPIAERAIIMQS